MINRYLKNTYPYFAHVRDKHKETLAEHTNLTFVYYNKLTKTTKDMTDQLAVITNYLQNCGIENSSVYDEVKNLFESAILLHDIGKINRNFQIEKMKNTYFGNEATEDSFHSIYSALIYLHIFKEKVITKNYTKMEQQVLLKIWLNFAYVISRHHGYLNNLECFEDAIRTALEKVENEPTIINEYLEVELLIQDKKQILYLINKTLRNKDSSSPNTALSFWFLCKTLFSFIVTCDFYATGEYMSQSEVNNFGEIENLAVFTNKYYSNSMIQKIRASHTQVENQGAPINNLRSKLFLEAEINFLKNNTETVFYLEAPTGCGKTLTSINLAVKAIEQCKEIKRIFYVFPFNTLVEQTAITLSSLFEESSLAVINSLEAIKVDETEDYNKSYLDRIMLHYPLIVTSHVHFFSALVGVSRESHLMLSHLRNSVVVIDEVQSYKNMIWQELIEVIHMAGMLYNIKFIIMSATLPKISKLTSHEGVQLICNPKEYFEHPLFKYRTVPKFELLKHDPITLDILCDEICSKIEYNEERILIEFIDKVSARSFYNLLKSRNTKEDYEILELTGDDPVYYREKLISRLKNQDSEGNFCLNKVVVIATQVIEAGVDIDMNIGYKDISIIDSEEQFAGRINRSCRLSEAPIYFFDLFNEALIYKNDVRINFTLRQTEARKWFCEKDYQKYFDSVLEILAHEKQRFTTNNIHNYFKLLSDLNYIEIHKHLRLIDQENITIFIPQTIEVDGVIIEGHEVWTKYDALLKDKEISYPRKQILLSRHKKLFSYFTYSVKYLPLSYKEDINKQVFLLGHGKFIEEGKFNRKAYNDENGKGIFSPEEMIL